MGSKATTRPVYLRNRERVVSKDDLIAAIWDGRIVSDAAVTTRINVARAAIGDSGEEQRLIRTLPRKGFRFVGAVREEEGPAAAKVAGTAEPPAYPRALRSGVGEAPRHEIAGGGSPCRRGHREIGDRTGTIIRGPGSPGSSATAPAVGSSFRAASAR